MEHFITFASGIKAKFIFNEIKCDLTLIGFIPSDKSLPISNVIPIKYCQGDKLFLRLAQPMIEQEADGVVVGDTFYILRSFYQEGQFMLALCVPTNPLFPSQSFDGKLYIKPFHMFPKNSLG